MEADLRMVLEKNRIWHVLWKQSRLLFLNDIFPSLRFSFLLSSGGPGNIGHVQFTSI